MQQFELKTPSNLKHTPCCSIPKRYNTPFMSDTENCSRLESPVLN